MAITENNPIYDCVITLTLNKRDNMSFKNIPKFSIKMELDKRPNFQIDLLYQIVCYYLTA